MSSQDKMMFPAMIRQLRVDSRLKQRQVAAAIGVASSSYANAEANNHKTLSLPRVHALADLHKVSDGIRADLVAAWEALPASQYNQRQARTWEARKLIRSKVRAHDALKAALVELVALLLGSVPDPAALCSCEPPDLFAEEPTTPPERCELCNALFLLGAGSWTNLPDVIARLAKVQEGMEQ